MVQWENFNVQIFLVKTGARVLKDRIHRYVAHPNTHHDHQVFRAAKMEKISAPFASAIVIPRARADAEWVRMILFVSVRLVADQPSQACARSWEEERRATALQRANDDPKNSHKLTFLVKTPAAGQANGGLIGGSRELLFRCLLFLSLGFLRGLRRCGRRLHRVSFGRFGGFGGAGFAFFVGGFRLVHGSLRANRDIRADLLH